MRDDNDDWGFSDEDWEKYEREAENDAKLRAAFLEYQRGEIARNRKFRVALQTETSLLEIHVYELIEDQIEEISWAALSALEQAQDAILRASTKPPR